MYYPFPILETIFVRKSFNNYLLVFLLLGFLYSASSWKAIPDSQSFLFTLVNPSGNQPTKITPKPDAAIRCKSDCGPTFGDSTQYYGLRVWARDYRRSYTSHLDLGYGFTCPENVHVGTYFTGVNPFEVSELEVFKVNL